MEPATTRDATNALRSRSRVLVDSHAPGWSSDGPTVWLPWCVAPLWVFLPIFGCLVAGAVRRPAVASGSLEPPAAVQVESSTEGIAPARLVRLATMHQR
ncbi:MAG: hypothetical protein ACO3NZ_07155 [Pirellulales bacterium]|jgi:hypothetical protein